MSTPSRRGSRSAARLGGVGGGGLSPPASAGYPLGFPPRSRSTDIRSTGDSKWLRAPRNRGDHGWAGLQRPLTLIRNFTGVENTEAHPPLLPICLPYSRHHAPWNGINQPGCSRALFLPRLGWNNSSGWTLNLSISIFKAGLSLSCISGIFARILLKPSLPPMCPYLFPQQHALRPPMYTFSSF